MIQSEITHAERFALPRRQNRKKHALSSPHSPPKNAVVPPPLRVLIDSSLLSRLCPNGRSTPIVDNSDLFGTSDMSRDDASMVIVGVVGDGGISVGIAAFAHC